MRVLVINAGSSSLKHALIETGNDTVLDSGEERWDPGAPAGRHAAALQAALHDADQAPEAIGHRVAHGGHQFDGPANIDEQARSAIRKLVALAPLHNRAALEGIEAARAAFPVTPQVACFDTAFHRTIPPSASTYAIPHGWTERYRVRRFGFHGLNVEWCAGRARDLLGASATERLIVCHLGSGSSVSAVLDGGSVDTSMGFTPMEGVPMATRSGSIDPGLILYLARAGLSIDELEHGLNDEAGLLGVSGRSSDLRDVLKGADDGDASCQLAFDVLVRGVAASVAAMTTALGGADCLVFTAGAGEGSARLRAAISERLAHLGIELDHARNESAAPDTEIGAEKAGVRVLVIRAGEEQIIARQTAALIGRR
jgi:acetate kinase